jgi:hypothetical protein
LDFGFHIEILGLEIWGGEGILFEFLLITCHVVDVVFTDKDFLG